MKNVFSVLLLLIVCSTGLYAQQTYAFVERDSTLYLDVYKPTAEANGYTVIHIFGGGFVNGSRTTKWDADYCRMLAANGYTAVAIDYRLGLRGVENVGFSSLSALENAFYMAAADCSAAVSYLVEHAEDIDINPEKIILEGSSAGAIAALMAEYGRCNKLDYAAELPGEWKPAGVVAYSGAIYSTAGKLKWADSPAPILLFHGTADRIVNYKQIEFARKGLYGANAIVKRLNKFNIPFCVYRYTDLGHEISIAGPLTIAELNMFVKQYIIDKRKLHCDITIRDDAYPPGEFSNKTVKDLYDKNRRTDLVK